jgi:hypothetical protein
LSTQKGTQESTHSISPRYLLRVWSCTAHPRFGGLLKPRRQGWQLPSCNWLTGRLKFMVQPLSILDLFALVPFFLDIIFEDGFRLFGNRCPSIHWSKWTHVLLCCAPVPHAQACCTHLADSLLSTQARVPWWPRPPPAAADAHILAAAVGAPGQCAADTCQGIPLALQRASGETSNAAVPQYRNIQLGTSVLCMCRP